MDHYQRQLHLSASPAAVYRALATQQGLRAWWTQHCDAAESASGHATFRFNGTRKTMRIDSLVPGREVRWTCVEAHIDAASLTHKDEWVGTEIVFRLAPEGSGTRLDFEHIGLSPEVECFEICQAGWDYFLGSLQRLVDTGQGSPHVDREPALQA